IHKEQWRIDMETGVPWFIPPPHIDPHQTPRRNHHHTPHKTQESLSRTQPRPTQAPDENYPRLPE
ncbi:hypothetical protein, partial [Arthrobacter sp. WCS2018Hpa-7]|uniref:hypothetical protein n=1 Tax=Arthrobacter sp. WCS2018Hpa-7 TaxID=3073632 RepID=UPI0028830F61